MAPRKPKTAPAAFVVEVAPAQPGMTYLTNPVVIAHATPKTRDEIAIRDVVRSRLAVVETAIMDFVAEKTAERFGLDDINTLYAVELPILFGYRFEVGRIRASYDGQIVER